MKFYLRFVLSTYGLFYRYRPKNSLKYFDIVENHGTKFHRNPFNVMKHADIWTDWQTSTLYYVFALCILAESWKCNFISGPPRQVEGEYFKMSSSFHMIFTLW